MPCCKFEPHVGYVLQTLDHPESKKMHLLCPLWNIIGSCGLQERIDDRSHQDNCYCQLRGPEQCKIASRDTGTYRVLSKVYPDICSNSNANGENVEERRDIILG